jgi:SAM-dependent methyltransferase
MTGAYDAVRYPGFPHCQTHPDRLATIATLLGLEPASPERCRVLEVGCGEGGNLLPMAYTLPGSHFLGIDASAFAVGRARDFAAALGMANVRFEQTDLAHVGDNSGTFDYVIAHGVYSWIPQSLREKLLELCGVVLARNGIAYVSYNALPGQRIRQMLREMMLFHVGIYEDPQQRVSQARALVDFIEDGGQAGLLAEEFQRIRDCTDWYLFHDDLAEINEAFWFHEFTDDAAAQGLRFLAEADFFDSDEQVFPESVRSTLSGMAAEDIRLKEQYLDFLKCRRFRQTLLCRVDLTVGRQPAPEKAAGMWVASQAVHRSGGVTPLADLTDRWPEYVPVSECGLEPELLVRLYASGVLDLHVQPAPFTVAVSEYPRASAVARLQATRSTVVTSLRHIPLDLESIEAARLLTTLDGTRHRDQIPDPDRLLDQFARLCLLEA